jgi:hypothetical protein
MILISDIANFGRGRDKMPRKRKGSMALTGAAAGAAIGGAIPLALAAIKYKRTGSFNPKLMNSRSLTTGLIGAGIGGVLGETVWNRKLGLEGTNFRDTMWDVNGKRYR